ncbi:uncharacterized protein LOC115627171 isoform X2 [Scaptodrosophila lebanonensis]|uniref:Uncharacterized protein LOC115627171 isoform X2 n=1 Tax=Drosophila lebanonensis TaxID=7225 RepID=A0A6J2TSV5_DROLE|nr:uncharacterized protein LOC115627171 isoform X2 [Scaptodrosophila lebanonensis]
MYHVNMQMQALNAVFEKQSGSIVFDGKYTNEYEAIKLLHTLHNRPTHERIIREFLTALEQLHHVESTGVASQRLREEGNQKYKSSSGDKELLLSACRLYTEAILTAENANNELCLAYANRGMALQDYGYYRQAYDDCACALEFGYPKKLHHKLIMRQAYCAWKLGNLELLEEHIHSLRGMQLNESFQRQLLELQENVQHLTQHKGAIEEQPVSAGESSVHQIVNEASSRGRYMIAKERIPQGSIIFTESAECFVPLEKHLICQQCAATQLIPIPCPNCHKRVVYCSRQCRERHKSIHKYECAAYKRDLLHMLGISHLALRLVLTYLPLLTPQLQKQRNASELWHTFISLANDDNDDDITAPQYLKTLRMITHLDKVSETELTYHMLCANLLRAYLFECTDFFDQFADTSAPSEDWQLFIAACILRSSGQLMVNGHVGDAIMPITLGLKEFTLLQPKLWDRPHHLQLGSLHKFSAFQLVTAMNLPHLSLCNHSCIPSIRTKFEGRSVVNYALRDIEANEEIFNCYTGDCKTTTFKERRKQLKNTFKFHCCCVNCRRQHPDEEYVNSEVLNFAALQRLIFPVYV